MKPSAVLLTIACAVWVTDAAGPEAGRKILYYRDPMHPSYTSDRPGKAPDCGMDLEPVYEESSGTTGAVVLGRVLRGSVQRTVKALGRVAPDENRVFPVVAGCEGWITKIEPGAATGDRVRKGQALASVYGREFATAERSFLYALKASENPPPALPGDESAPALTLQEARRYLENLGMGAAQIGELERTRSVILDVVLTSPASGVVLSRGAYPRQRFDRDAELFRIADLARVWILADLAADDPADVPAGTVARVTAPGSAKQPLTATVSGALPRFDATSRTAKLRLEADNPGLVLRPDMLVDVELPVTLPDVTTVPASAILDAGGGKTVFVDRDGRREPRSVRIGRRFGDRVEIVEGLAPGESIVVSGAFLVGHD
jgi:RND family efflux transporter MFP subunit